MLVLGYDLIKPHNSHFCTLGSPGPPGKESGNADWEIMGEDHVERVPEIMWTWGEVCPLSIPGKWPDDFILSWHLSAPPARPQAEQQKTAYVDPVNP